jgi:hypothetical protein
VIVRVCENKRVAFNAPTPASYVFWPRVIIFPHAPPAISVENYDAGRTYLAGVEPIPNDELRVIPLGNCGDRAHTEQSNRHRDNERSHAPNEISTPKWRN